ncbi:Multicopper oxidase [Olea europaea subsp. europaea]|uniref:Laccase n=1 Tax=Olea europaea subsp. europaea TaxID=158383 RepID=A0A8S0SPI6_OLEEU|nr:Multicopper oxidase [Olea europaea subsp. europaea]
MKVSPLHLIGFLLLAGVLPIHAALIRRYKFVLTDTPYTRLCTNKSILVVNGQFPGPTLHATEGDTLVVDVQNRASENVTIHWHGVKQHRYPWSDGPVYITQCPIQPGSKFSQKIFLSNEIGTLWWHAHSDWSRATVHGAIVIYPRKKNNYPFRKPHAEVPIILGEWWNSDIQAVLTEFLDNGGDPNVSDAFLINGQPGDLYPCSRSDTFKLTVEYGKTYLIRSVTIVGSDASYTKQIRSDYIAISPGQTIDFLLKANQKPSHYYMAAHAYASAATYDNTTTTAIIEYRGNYTPPSSPLLPSLPTFNDINASVNFTGRLRSLGNKDYPVHVPKNVTNAFLFTISINLTPCPNDSCVGPYNERLLASVNNITFVQPTISILQAYYQHIRNIYGDDFPSHPPFAFNYTADFVPKALWRPQNGTEVRVLKYNSSVEIVFQGTNTVGGIDHPMHLHGHSFYVVGWGFGNFDKDNDPSNYNLVDPPLMNTIAVPINGWTTIRFQASNPGT